MAILYPGAEHHLLANKSTTPITPLVVNVHTMVDTLPGTESYFSKSGNPYSHFGTGGDGSVWQWQELDFRAASDLDGNPYCISIENEDTGTLFPVWSGSDVPRFTPAQAESLAQLIAWLCTRFGLPTNLIPNSIYGQTGVGYHRLGVDPYRVPNGVKWSNAYGKACPGDRRIAQLRDEIMPRVRALIAPPPVSEEDDDMPYLHSSRYTGVHVVDGQGCTWLSSSATVSELMAQGVKVYTMDASEDDARRFLNDRNAATDEAILASEKSQEAYLASIEAAVGTKHEPD